MQKAIDLAKKLQALAQKGVDGEKLNAEKLLEAHLQRHNLTMDDITGDETNEYYFTIDNDDEVKLWQQIVAVIDKNIKKYKFDKKTIKTYALKGNCMLQCTPAQYIEIESMFVTYKRLYAQEIKVFYRAFLTANDLLVIPDTTKDNTDYSTMSKDEISNLLRASAMASSIKTETHRKQLNK
jgi:hypothetical protein